MPFDKPTLYGLTSKNSSRHGRQLWGKNQFNSTFPLSLCLFMRDNDFNPVAVIVRNDKIVVAENIWTMAEVVGEKTANTFFYFEQRFEPYKRLSRNEVDKIDLVVAIDGKHCIPLEVKLTVVPDITTADKENTMWAPEMVMRPVSSAHAIMSVATSLSAKRRANTKSQVISVLKSAYNNVSDWGNAAEIDKNAENLTEALSETIKITAKLQRPFLMQPLWRTEGQSLVLCKQCFDVFVWSDVAILQVPLNQALKSQNVGRALREVARHVRALYDLLVAGDYDYIGIYKGMALGHQTDKAFALSGQNVSAYLQHPRLHRPLLPNNVLKRLILNGGERELKPERRFDAAVQSHMRFNPLSNEQE